MENLKIDYHFLTKKASADRQMDATKELFEMKSNHSWSGSHMSILQS